MFDFYEEIKTSLLLISNGYVFVMFDKFSFHTPGKVWSEKKDDKKIIT